MTTRSLAESKTSSTNGTPGSESSLANVCVSCRAKLPKNAKEKGLRLLMSGRLRVLRVDGDVIVAECRGDSGGVYSLGHDPNRAPHWRCTCEARTTCSHLHALWLVTAV